MTCCQPPIVRRWICRQDGEVLAQGLLWMVAQAWLWWFSFFLWNRRWARLPYSWYPMAQTCYLPRMAGRLLWNEITWFSWSSNPFNTKVCIIQLLGDTIGKIQDVQQSWQTWKVQVSYNKGGGTGLAPEPPFPMGYIQNSWVALYCRCPSVSWRCHLDSWVSSWVDTLNSLVTSPWRCPSVRSPVLGIVIILLLAEGVLLSGHLGFLAFCQS